MTDVNDVRDVKCVSTHPETLDDGRVLAPGETATDVELTAHNQQLLDEGAIAVLAEVPVDLSTLSRDQLNAMAVTAGVTDPEKLANKDAVIDAIQNQKGS